MELGNREETERLIPVFDVLDTEKAGYISVDRFAELASEHLNNSGLDSTKNEVCLSRRITTSTVP